MVIIIIKQQASVGGMGVGGTERVREREREREGKKWVGGYRNIYIQD